jgi:hypothetical protein
MLSSLTFGYEFYMNSILLASQVDLTQNHIRIYHRAEPFTVSRILLYVYLIHVSLLGRLGKVSLIEIGLPTVTNSYQQYLLQSDRCSCFPPCLGRDFTNILGSLAAWPLAAFPPPVLLFEAILGLLIPRLVTP